MIPLTLVLIGQSRIYHPEVKYLTVDYHRWHCEDKNEDKSENVPEADRLNTFLHIIVNVAIWHLNAMIIELGSILFTGGPGPILQFENKNGPDNVK